MDMLYYIYIGSNRVTIDHLSKITGGMFMAVSSCNKAAKVIDGIRERYNTHSGRSQKINHSQITRRCTVVAHQLQRFIGVGVLNNLCGFHLMNPSHRTFHDEVLILKPREETGQDPADVVYGHFTRPSLNLIVG